MLNIKDLAACLRLMTTDEEFFEVSLNLKSISQSVSEENIPNLWEARDWRLNNNPLFAVEQYRNFIDTDYWYTLANEYTDIDKAVTSISDHNNFMTFSFSGLVVVRRIGDIVDLRSDDYKRSFMELCGQYVRDEGRLWSLEMYLDNKAYTIIPIA